jgi:hypothetical protein
VISPPTTRTRADEVAALLSSYLYAPGGFAAMLSRNCRALLKDTTISVPPAPTAAQLGSVHAKADEHLMGIFTTPPARIAVFANEADALGIDPRDILKEELGHRFHFDHDLREARIPVLASASGVLCHGPHDMGGRPMGAAALDVLEKPPVHDTGYCPVCHSVRDMAHATFLLEYARETTWLAAQPEEVPLGIGGTVPVMRRDIACAQFDLTRANDAGMLVNQQGELRDACRLLDLAQAALVGILNRDQMSAAFAPVKKAAWACAVLTHSHFVYKFHGDDPALRLSDLQVIKAFSGA